MISSELIETVLTTGFQAPAHKGQIERITEGLPEGAKLVGAEFDPFKNLVRLLFEHESFDPAPDGQPIPYLNPVASRIVEEG